MLSLKPTACAGLCCAVAIGVASLADAASTQKAKTIRTTQRVIILSAGGSSVADVGTSDGKIAGTSVDGALRAVSSDTTPPKFTATGTLFYSAGTLKYKFNGLLTSSLGGGLRISGTGTFTGGTGTYAGAHGNFTLSGTKPPNSFETTTISGHVSYR